MYTTALGWLIVLSLACLWGQQPVRAAITDIIRYPSVCDVRIECATMHKPLLDSLLYHLIIELESDYGTSLAEHCKLENVLEKIPTISLFWSSIWEKIPFKLFLVEPSVETSLFGYTFRRQLELFNVHNLSLANIMILDSSIASGTVRSFQLDADFIDQYIYPETAVVGMTATTTGAAATAERAAAKGVGTSGVLDNSSTATVLNRTRVVLEQVYHTGTMVINNAHSVDSTVAKAADFFSRAFRVPFISVNAYTTRMGQPTSAPLHTDKMDSFVLQTQGAKRWVIYGVHPDHAATAATDATADAEGEPRGDEDTGADRNRDRDRDRDRESHTPWEHPLEDLGGKDRGKMGHILGTGDVGTIWIDTVLRAGEVIYIPRGVPHRTGTVMPDARADTSVEGSGVGDHASSWADATTAAGEKAASGVDVVGEEPVNADEDIDMDVEAAVVDSVSLSLTISLLAGSVGLTYDKLLRCAVTQLLCPEQGSVETEVLNTAGGIGGNATTQTQTQCIALRAAERWAVRDHAMRRSFLVPGNGNVDDTDIITGSTATATTTKGARNDPPMPSPFANLQSMCGGSGYHGGDGDVVDEVDDYESDSDKGMQLNKMLLQQQQQQQQQLQQQQQRLQQQHGSRQRWACGQFSELMDLLYEVVSTTYPSCVVSMNFDNTDSSNSRKNSSKACSGASVGADPSGSTTNIAPLLSTLFVQLQQRPWSYFTLDPSRYVGTLDAEMITAAAAAAGGGGGGGGAGDSGTSDASGIYTEEAEAESQCIIQYRSSTQSLATWGRSALYQRLFDQHLAQNAYNMVQQVASKICQGYAMQSFMTELGVMDTDPRYLLDSHADGSEVDPQCTALQRSEAFKLQHGASTLDIYLNKCYDNYHYTLNPVVVDGDAEVSVDDLDLHNIKLVLGENKQQKIQDSNRKPKPRRRLRLKQRRRYHPIPINNRQEITKGLQGENFFMPAYCPRPKPVVLMNSGADE